MIQIYVKFFVEHQVNSFSNLWNRTIVRMPESLVNSGDLKFGIQNIQLEKVRIGFKF